MRILLTTDPTDPTDRSAAQVVAFAARLGVEVVAIGEIASVHAIDLARVRTVPAMLGAGGELSVDEFARIIDEHEIGMIALPTAESAHERRFEAACAELVRRRCDLQVVVFPHHEARP